MKYKIMNLSFLFLLLLSWEVKVNAAAAKWELASVEREEYMEELLEEAGMSLKELEEKVDKSSLKGSISFEEIIEKLWRGDMEGLWTNLAGLVKEALLSELSQNYKNFIQIILLAVFAALFTNIGTGIFSSSLQQTGFFVIYLGMTGILLKSFSLMLTVTEELLEEVFSFMEVFIPVYAMAITMVCGSAAAIALYEFTFLLVKGCEWGLWHLIIPIIELYMMIGIVNCISDTDRFSYMGSLLKKGTEQALKGMAGLILGLNVIQNMILPAVDSVQSLVWKKGLSVVPGAGAILSVVTDTLLGAFVLIKNSIGAACLIVLILLCIIPIIKLVVFMISFYLCCALLQPVSDRRLMNLLHVTGESGRLLLQVIILCVTFFFLTIALAAASTNMRYYGG